jgi:hypothetical protein
MEWRDAAISSSFDPAWSNPQYLQENGLLPAERHLANSVMAMDAGEPRWSLRLGSITICS